MTDRISTVNLTLTIVTPGGVPADITPAVIADIAAYQTRVVLAQARTRATVTGTVSSAFIVRTEEVPA